MKVKVKSKLQTDFYKKKKLGPLLQTVLFNLGIKEDQINDYLDIHNQELADPQTIFGIEKAAKYILKSVEEKKKIVIHGDYDVDGVCATTILWDYLYFNLKADVTPIIPNRADDGYGISENTITKALNMDANLLISVDCGIKDVDLVNKYEKRIDFVITDHHQFLTDEKGKIKIPKAKAVVHSAHPKGKYPSMISGAATAWQLVRMIDCILNESKRAEGSDSINLDKSLTKVDTFDVNNYLDLVAFSTICDIIPLTNENRKMVIKGLEKFRITERYGLQELMKISQIDQELIQTYHFGFVLGPRINASGRVTNDAMDSLRLLSTRNESQAIELASRLNELNLSRQAMTDEYIELSEKFVDPESKIIVVLGEEWPEGILGLIAGKLAEKYFKPTYVASMNKSGAIVGSSRSPLDNFFLHKSLEHASEFLTRFGGHKQAAGFASDKEKFRVDEFEKKLNEYLSKNLNEEDFEKNFNVEAEIDSLDGITIDSVKELAQLEPFGLGNPKPLFILKNVLLEDKTLFGSQSNHVRFQFNVKGKRITGKTFNGVEKFNSIEIREFYDVLGHFAVNEWNGRKSLEFDVKEIL